MTRGPRPRWTARGGLGETHDAGTAEGDDRLVLFTYPLLVDEGRLSEHADELKAALEDEAFVELHPAEAAAIGVVDGARATVRTEAGEAELPVVVTEHVARGRRSCPSTSPASRRTPCCRGRCLRAQVSRRSAARPRAGLPPRRPRWEVTPDGLGRLGDPRRAGRDRVLRPADRRDALHLDGAQGDRRHADPVGRCAPGPAAC